MQFKIPNSEELYIWTAFGENFFSIPSFPFDDDAYSDRDKWVTIFDEAPEKSEDKIEKEKFES